MQTRCVHSLPRQVAGSYAALASLLRAASRGEEARTYAKVALEAKERAFPAGHPEVAAALLALADLLREQARQAKPWQDTQA